MARNAFFPLTLIAIVWLARIMHMSPGISVVLVGTSWLTAIAHELGHVAVLKCTGGRVRSVIPMPFMGITFHDPDHRTHQAALALAGPVAGAAFGASALVALHVLALPHTLQHSALQLVLRAGIIDNLVFNLIPWGPLDGAYLLKALKEWRAEHAFRRQTDRQLRAACVSAHPAAGAIPPAPAVRRRDSRRPLRASAAHTEARWQVAGTRPARSHSCSADLS